jgi:hypothetical protein
MDKQPSCSNCPYGLQTTARDGKAYQCRIDAPRVSPLPNGLQTTAGWPVVDADELCGRHPLHPGQRDRIAERMVHGLLAVNILSPDILMNEAFYLANAFMRAKETK